MAGLAHAHHHGDMDVREQQATFRAVIAGAKWSCLTLAVSVLFLTLWLCTDAGFMRAILSAAVIAAVGVFGLRNRTPSS
jgi:hypothetical protein